MSTLPSLPCRRCGTERSIDCYCTATEECRWYATLHQTSEGNERQWRMSRGERYPSWGPAWVHGMPLILSPEIGKVVHDAMSYIQLSIEQALAMLVEMGRR